MQIEEFNDNFFLTALKHCEGDQQKADYLLDTTISNWFYRLSLKGKYGEWFKQVNKLK